MVADWSQASWPRVKSLIEHKYKSNLQYKMCMAEFTVHTSEHLPALLQGFPKQAGLRQAEMAKRLGITQQTLSAFERNADKASAQRLLEYLSSLGVQLLLRLSQQGRPPVTTTVVGW